jgi:4-diphosphocytidyl-2-C-methyl-D-erythritol kinase
MSLEILFLNQRSKINLSPVILYGNRTNMQKIANAKVNLFLDVLNRRPDGYHNIGTLFQSVSIGDEINFCEPDLRGAIELEVVGGPQIPTEKNLAWRAADLLRSRYAPGASAKIRLIKKLPDGAGLGGGSADAATVLVGLNEYWGLGLASEKLELLGAKLGADVPFMVGGGTAWGEGIGELLEPISLELEDALLVATPCVHSATAEAYAGLKPSGTQRYEQFKRSFDAKNPFKAAYNKFEESIFPQHPHLQEVRNYLLSSGAHTALLSGSGASVFGVFKQEQTAIQAKGTYPFPQRFLEVCKFSCKKPL